MNNSRSSSLLAAAGGRVSLNRFCGGTLILLSFLLWQLPVCAQDTLKVHFLYGSKPAHGYRKTEKKWFGGIHGGHVGIECQPNVVFSFVPSGKYHIFSHHKLSKLHGRFTTHSPHDFLQCLGGKAASMKAAYIHIPVTPEQKQQFLEIQKAYLSKTPYDYAFLGMRCAAASYDLLAQLSLVKKHGLTGTYLRNFVPKPTRKRLLKLAAEKGWKVITHEGTTTRKWEKP